MTVSVRPCWRWIWITGGGLGFAGLWMGLSLGASAPQAFNFQAPVGAPGEELFSDGKVRRIHLEVLPSAMEALEKDSRSYVLASIREGTMRYENAALHLKGAKGSFRKLEEKPGFTLDFQRFSPGQTFFGLRRIHLNNSVEDPSYLNEKIGSELFRAAGVPAPRVAHALVSLNGRELGLYVVKEGFTRDFLGLYFKNTHGNLYDTGVGHDVDERMERDSGSGPDDRSDLQALAEAAREPDLARRWLRLEQILDLNRVISFMAMEVMAGHGDGYGLARNNFRVYHDLDSDRLLFFPHGMDRLFMRADLPWRPHMAGLVSRALLETTEGRRRYRERMQELLASVFQAKRLANRIDQWVAQIRPGLGRAEARKLGQEAERLKARVVERAAELDKQLSEPEPEPVSFTNGVARLSGWRGLGAPAGGKLEQGNAPDGRLSLRIQAGPNTSASWRTKVMIKRGAYRFEGRIRTRGVEPLPFGKNKGAGLRLSGAEPPRPHQLVGDAPWQLQTVEFEVAAVLDEVELVCELRASKGEAWFDLESLRLVRLK